MGVSKLGDGRGEGDWACVPPGLSPGDGVGEPSDIWVSNPRAAELGT
jgi:hypothetical protein